MTKIIKCKVQDILGVKNIEIAPNGESVTIGGGNGEGKSSLIKSLIMATAGKSKVPEMPVREGAEKGITEIEMDEFNVQFEVLPDRKTKLTVIDKLGRKMSNAQTVLNQLFGDKIAFDPGEFKAFDKTKRADVLRRLAGLDLAEIDAEIERAYFERTTANALVKTGKTFLSQLEFDESLPEKEISVAELSEEFDNANSCIDHYNSLSRALETTAGEMESHRETLAELEDRAKRVRGMMAEAQTVNAKIRKQIDDFGELPDRQAIIAKISEAEATNEKIRQNVKYREAAEGLEESGKTAQEISNRLDKLRSNKAALIAEAPLPIEGLGFSEDGGITHNGVPFEQLSESQQWDISTAISFKLNPQGVVFMSHSGGLDIKSRRRIMERSASLGVQLFLEVVDDADDVMVLIEKGEVLEDRS